MKWAVEEAETEDISINQFSTYSEYKSLGKDWEETFPSHWESRQLQFWIHNVTEQGQEGDERPFITLEHIESETGKLIENFDWDYKESDGYYLFEEGDVLFGKLRPYLRKYYKVNKKGCSGTDLMVFRPVDGRVDSKYLYYFLHSEFFITHAVANSYGVKMPRTSWDKLASYEFCFPEINEQKTIVKFLDREAKKIDRLIERKEELIDLLEEKRTALITEAVTQGLDPDVEMKDSGVEWLGEIPEHWEVMSVWMLFKLGRGRVISKEDMEKTPDKYPVYSSQTGEEGVMGYLDTYDFEGDYLTWTTDGAHAGTVFRRSGKFNCTNVCGTLKPWGREVVLSYFHHVLDHATSWFVRHDINPKLMNKVMSDIKVPVPPLKEQKEIANKIESVTQDTNPVKKKIEEAIERLKEYRTALITAAVTGKIDVRNEV